MERRKFIAGLGSLTAAGAAGIGTGAFTSVTAERGVNVNVAPDANAYLGLDQISGEPNSQDYTSINDGELKLFDTGTVDGSGFNLDAVTLVDNLFKIKNQSSQKQYVWLSEIGDPNGPAGGSQFTSGQRPTGMFFVGFYAPGDRSGTWDGISYGSSPEDPNNPNNRGPDQPNDKRPADAAPFNGNGEVEQPSGDRAAAVGIAAGDEVKVGMAVDTTMAGQWIDSDVELSPGDLLDRVIVKSVADSADTPVTL
ncbi:hypothetical protein B4589_011455 [Halolamina sp. CBA1230]|uniref:hypothetical protein n=1 Tax=Halolamina sp. CBA1230 TaxID=1853690 RepID=UPI001179F459|nr:hypothetical protein [Halolamina sp. CBA1230]QKY20959.1 hypothetical protein B4589_011455 [Halolamina sp. CBA1230]